MSEYADSLYIGGTPSEELRDFMGAEQRCYNTASGILDLVGKRVVSYEVYQLPDIKNDIFVQQIASPPLRLDRDPDGKPCDYTANIGIKYQMGMMPGQTMVDMLPYQGVAWFSLRLTVGDKRNPHHDFVRTNCMTYGHIDNFSTPFCSHGAGMQMTPELQDLAHSRDERATQAEYGKWLAVIGQSIA
ncbi:MAG TPA: hypothetical protein VLG16_00425 [Candidatus Saccharimonadales bacterium]|nr:hypothetical protein [Candidatus Saccharimonadales bacterium]